MAKKKKELGLEETANNEEEMTNENEEEMTEETTEPTGETFDIDVSTIPALSGLAVGDTISFKVEKISEDGNTYTLSPAVETGGTSSVPTGEGRQEVARALL